MEADRGCQFRGEEQRASDEAISKDERKSRGLTARRVQFGFGPIHSVSMYAMLFKCM